MKKQNTAVFKSLIAASLYVCFVAGCAYKPPVGQWQVIDAPGIYFDGVFLDDAAKTSNYASICNEARDEIMAQLSKKIPERILPLKFNVNKNTNEKNAILKINITQCEIDSDQSGGSFSYYLTLPVTVSVNLGDKNLLTYNMQTYEQISVDQPSPNFEFTFAEPIQRTLVLFNGRKLWQKTN